MSNTKKPKRCQMDGCRKKLLLTDYQCRCQKYFCSLHRLPEKHQCTFNYKEERNDDKLIKDMKCVQEKIDNI